MGSDVVLLTKYWRPWQVMAQQGAALQTYNNELVKSLEELQARRQILQQQIEADMKEKAKLEDEKRVVEERLGKVSHSQGAKLAARKEYDRVIGEAEQAYTRFLSPVKFFSMLFSPGVKISGKLSNNHQKQRVLWAIITRSPVLTRAFTSETQLHSDKNQYLHLYQNLI